MSRFNHLVVHYLDIARHWASTYPLLVLLVIALAVFAFLWWWKPGAWVRVHFTAAQEAHIEALVKTHVAAASTEIHSKLDQLLNLAKTTATKEKTPMSEVTALATEAYDDIAKRFRHLPPADDVVALAHANVRTVLEDAARQLVALVPGAREASLLLTKLEEAGFWAHAGIARNQPAAPAAPAAPVAPGATPTAATEVPAPAAPAEPAPAAAPVVDSAPADLPTGVSPSQLFTYSGTAAPDTAVWPLAGVVTPEGQVLYTWGGSGQAPEAPGWTAYSGTTTLPAPATPAAPAAPPASA